MVVEPIFSTHLQSDVSIKSQNMLHKFFVIMYRDESMFGNSKKRSLSSEEFLDVANIIESYTTITTLLEGFAKTLGVKFSFYTHYPPVGAFDFNSSGIFYPYNAPYEVACYFETYSNYNEDPVSIAVLEKGKFIWLSEAVFEDQVIKTNHQDMVHTALKYAGEGLCCPLYGPDNRKGYAFLGFRRDKSEFDSIMPYQIHALAQMTHIRYCLMIKGLQRQIKLTTRESEVLELISYGKTNPEIAVILGISPRTVAVHASKIFVKLGTSDRINAAMRAQTIDIIV